jgi:hypothetical protein
LGGELALANNLASLSEEKLTLMNFWKQMFLNSFPSGRTIVVTHCFAEVLKWTE